MISLRIGVKMVLMKKLSLYIFFVLIWCNIGFSQISLIDIKIGDKITNHFNSNQISKYYIFNAEKTSKGEQVYGIDQKYSFISIDDTSLFKENFLVIQIYYENQTGKIVSTAGVDLVESKEECIEKRTKDVKNYKKMNRVTSLFSKREGTHKFPDGMIDDFILFEDKNKFFSFSCYVYADGMKTYRVEVYQNEYNDFIFKKFNEN